jgi:CopA family copper-resistance protein
MVKIFLLLVMFLLVSIQAKAQELIPEIHGDTIIYRLTINYKTVNYSGKDKEALAVNGSIPAPTLNFVEGKYAVIYVTNELDTESSVHWHGLILPNFQDGVPYLNTPPILSNQVQKFEFPLVQSGTYWYHSHTGLQEQRGVYGAIIIKPKKPRLDYDHDFALVLSDWTDENPDQVLRTLKRGNEWYSIKKGTVQSLNKVIKKRALGAQFKMWKKHMPGMDISDVYYDAFLNNGQQNQVYSQFKPGEKVRVRIVNASAATYFWLAFGGVNPVLISADGMDVQPIRTNKVLHAIAETYDFIITIPENNSLEFKAYAQDGSGVTSAIFGTGEPLKAPFIPKPDLVEMMKKMVSMDMDNKDMDDMDMDDMDMKNDSMGLDKMNMENDKMNMKDDSLNMSSMTMDNMGMMEPVDVPIYSYDALKAIENTSLPKDAPVKEIEMNLTGNMWRYIWSMDKKVLSEVDKIEIKQGEIVRITMVNKTMMHHPMHLHGHFFRVLNKNNEYSPLKHTVDVPPMGKVTIEFDANEYGDWFFHCHILYHMKGGMARVFTYNTPRDERLADSPLKNVLNTDKHWFKWGILNLMSNRADLSLTASNTRNQFLLDGTFGWFDNSYQINTNFELDLSYERFIGDYFRVYLGGDVENDSANVLDQYDAVGRVGFRYLLPYFIDLDVSMDHKMRPQLGLEYDLLVFQKLELFTMWQWQMNFGIVESLPTAITWQREYQWNAGFNYIFSKNFSVIGSYDNRFGWGAGFSWRM